MAGAAGMAGAAQGRGISSETATGAAPTFVTLAPTAGVLRAHIAPDAGGEMAGLEYVIGGKPVELLYRGMDYSPTQDWTGKAPTLWPAVGTNQIPSENGGKPFAGWISNGKRYPMHGHGFVREHRWRLEDHRSGERVASATLSTVDGPQTRQFYPFGFKFTTEYRVAGTSVVLRQRISAPKSNSGSMPFSIGNHITFKMPFAPGGNRDLATITSSGTRKVLLGQPGNKPTGEVVEVDFSKPRLISSLGIRTPTSLSGCPPGNAWTRLEDPAGMAITLSHQADWRPAGNPVLFNLWGDVPNGFFAPEPWLGQQDSLVTGNGLILLPPGEDFEWRIEVDVTLFGDLAKA